jgi:dipeptidyl-peptidase-4
MLPLGAFAQDFSYLHVREASPEGKTLTVEDATFGRGVRPVAKFFTWEDDATLQCFEKDSVRHLPLSGGEEWMTLRPSPTDRKHVLPQGASGAVTAAGRTAYTLDGSVYIEEGGVSSLVIQGGDGIVCGETVSRNEFGINGGLFWSPDGSRLAFYRKDETRVTDFPLLDVKTRTGELRTIKYPMNGMASERITLGIYDLAARTTVWVRPDDFDKERYLTCVSWDPSSAHVFIQVLDRKQHHMHLNMYDASDGSFVKTLLVEENEAWVEPWEPLHFIDDATFIYSTDNRDGYKSLYVCDLDGGIRRLAPCAADVQFAAYADGYVYYTSAEVSPVENHLFRVRLRPARRGGLAKMRIDAPQRLTFDEGWHAVRFNESHTHFIDSWSAFDVPQACALRRCDGTLVRELDRTADPLEGVATGEIRFGTVRSADGAFNNYFRLYLPVGFDPAQKYPVIVYVYGGPHSQMVQDRWLAGIRPLEMYWAQHGFVVYVQDNRGTSNRGAAFEKAINRQCGQAEMQDQMAGIRELLKAPWTDASRVGVHGWSYGGFMTISLLTNYPEVFKVGVAGGPVIDWKWYEVMYGERYMDTPATNPEGFEKTSLMNKTSALKGKLLICQGAIDNTVVWEHSLSFTQKCVEEGVQLDYFPYPCSEHNVAGPWRVHLNQKIVSYFEDYL